MARRGHAIIPDTPLNAASVASDSGRRREGGTERERESERERERVRVRERKREKNKDKI